MAEFTSAAAAREYTLAGNATITLQSRISQAHFTYRVRTYEGSHRHSVSLLTGPDNGGDFTYLGLLGDSGIILTKASKATRETPGVRAFDYFWKWMAHGEISPNLSIRHEGRCGRCARKLTTPESIDRGIGPECAMKMECV